jgi:deoxyribodipyrimidine photo-lyase
VAKSGYIKVASAENAAAVDHDPPLQILRDAVLNNDDPKDPGSAVVYWMRMEDLRSTYPSNIRQESAILT